MTALTSLFCPHSSHFLKLHYISDHIFLCGILSFGRIFYYSLLVSHVLFLAVFPLSQWKEHTLLSFVRCRILLRSNISLRSQLKTKFHLLFLYNSLSYQHLHCHLSFHQTCLHCLHRIFCMFPLPWSVTEIKANSFLIFWSRVSC